MSDFHDDPRWKEAQQRYLADDPENPDATFAERVQAAFDMREIEREHRLSDASNARLPFPYQPALATTRPSPAPCFPSRPDGPTRNDP